MKKTKSQKTGSSKKRKAHPESVKEYLAGVPEPAREMLSELRAAIRSVVPAAATETISYRITSVQAQRHTGLVRGVFGPLQFVPHGGGD